MEQENDLYSQLLGQATTSAIAGPLVGMGLGILGNFLSPEKDTSPFDDPYAAKRRAEIESLTSGRAGAQLANAAKADIGRQSQLAFESLSNSDFGGSVAMRTAAFNATQRAGQDAMVRAQTEGAALDERNKQAAVGLMQQDSLLGHGQWLEDQRRRNQPSFFETLTQNSLASAAGSFQGALSQAPQLRALERFQQKPTSQAPGTNPAASLGLTGTALPDAQPGMQDYYWKWMEQFGLGIK